MLNRSSEDSYNELGSDRERVVIPGFRSIAATLIADPAASPGWFECST